jgi:hypothetical protein
VVEELVAIVDPRTRKVEIVFPRWEAVSCMTANPEGGRKRLLQPRLALQRAAGRPDMHLRRVTSMMREARCSQVERTHDQVEQ